MTRVLLLAASIGAGHVGATQILLPLAQRTTAGLVEKFTEIVSYRLRFWSVA